MIVIVDDNADDRDIIEAALAAADRDVRVLGFDSGEAVLQYLADEHSRGKPQNPRTRLVLLDLKMPRLDGLDVLRRIRAQSRTAGLPVVMCTSSREAHDIESCYRSGANGYLCKPVDFEHLTRQMRAVTEFWIHHNEPWN